MRFVRQLELKVGDAGEVIVPTVLRHDPEEVIHRALSALRLEDTMPLEEVRRHVPSLLRRGDGRSVVVDARGADICEYPSRDHPTFAARESEASLSRAMEGGEELRKVRKAIPREAVALQGLREYPIENIYMLGPRIDP